jgi:amidophosphoribosyltransferase
MSDFLGEACGVFGAYNVEGGHVISHLYWGLISQNHRGHHSHGFITFDEGFSVHHGLGLLPPVRDPATQKLFERLRGSVGIGHVRYATSGKDDRSWLMRDVQPFVEEKGNVKVALAYNGNIVNAGQLRRELESEFGNLSASSDVELISKKLVQGLKRGLDLTASVEACMREIEGAFSVVGLTQEGELFAFRDPLGIRPLCYGHSEDGRILAVSSESVGLDINNFRYESEVRPGELLVLSKDGFRREQLVRSERRAFCSFEFAYFARPDSILNGGNKPVYKIREDFGRNLGGEDKDITNKIDVIISIPETGDDAAYGLHEQTGIPWERALRKHRYVTDRAFIVTKEEREMIIMKKLNIGGAIKGKRIGVTEDSIVRGDTSRRIIKRMREAGAKEVHMYITFPRIISPCFYGIDMSTFGELVGARHDADEIAGVIGADSVHYQSIENFVRATGLRREELCLGCLTCEYPTPLAQKLADEMKARFERGEKEAGRIYESS